MIKYFYHHYVEIEKKSNLLASICPSKFKKKKQIYLFYNEFLGTTQKAV